MHSGSKRILHIRVSDGLRYKWSITRPARDIKVEGPSSRPSKRTCAELHDSKLFRPFWSLNTVHSFDGLNGAHQTSRGENLEFVAARSVASQSAAAVVQVEEEHAVFGPAVAWEEPDR
jgi:hypothetical protein